MKSVIYVLMWLLYAAWVNNPVKGCQRVSYAADIVFLLDSSGSVKVQNFKKQLQFISTFATTVPIGPNNIQIGIESFSDAIHHHFDLDDYTNSTSLQDAVHSVPYIKGNTRTAEALRWVMDNSFTNTTGDREEIQNILIVTTDGKSTNKKETLSAAEELHRRNFTSICIGIGGKVVNEEIRSIASEPQNAVTVKNFDDLASVVLNLTLKRLQEYACDGYYQTTEPTTSATVEKEIHPRNSHHPWHISESQRKLFRTVEIGVLTLVSFIMIGSAICCCRHLLGFGKSNDDDEDEEKITLGEKTIHNKDDTVSPSRISVIEYCDMSPKATTCVDNFNW